ncbi:mannose-1-phosphate guanylyltransferase [Pedobacter sp. MC2016-15]|uniref:mannose-1-phosphate guanylyltransferase n=1 Tax=Pedobacter sp. MC2016-15 TaxID=2994473 RepID=UPI0022467723|nr:mannose-1-phosphate guanylyltransferase [Pedobacter sp. MC2016-15]MCX2481818.1 mannose-1-phosphate guanylyltransferase [Pedobacter sp. MC2016-15]
MKDTYVLIMAGGVGSRFWPKSRNNFPKQFIDILGIGKSLLQLTHERFQKICPQENIFILSNEQYSGLVAQQLPDLPTENIISEPSRNNTAPCIAYASFKINQINPLAKIVVAPSDHLILNEKVFLEKIEQALSYVSTNDALVTLGITPTRPDTGYGYINYEKEPKDGVHQVLRFLEKPNLEKAQEFVASGDYLWNGGIFVWRVESILGALAKYSPAIFGLFEKGKSCYNTDSEKSFILENYPLSDNISIDYAIMEKADNVYTIPGEFGWSDLGTWASLYEVVEKDEFNNAFSGHSINLSDTTNCMIQIPKDKVAVVKGLDNYIVVDDGKVLLIYPKAHEQEIKEVSKSIVNTCGQEFA